ncbi:MAG TPA: 3-dehydroquinate synthase, partial [Bryobacteraceae bacterium]|nr:3-dehydroquinate synthase [Bryobacteraceae bacterium]
LRRLSDYIPQGAGRIFIASNQEVWRHHGNKVDSALPGTPYEVLFFPSGEEYKRFSSVETMAEEMVRAGADRSSIVVAFGGGVVGDMAGFLAAIFMRGVPVIQVPTTVVAQVDAAVGGKTGVNLTSGKNLIGAFHQPSAVVVDPEVLETLPEREYRAGLFEVVKHGVIASAPLFRTMKSSVRAVLAQVPDAVEYTISESVRIKAEVVSADEREGGLRRILNFGHTFGHALEAETGYTRFLHGEAVGFGILAATELARRLGMLSDADAAEIAATTRLYGPVPPLNGVAAEALAARMTADKKTVRGKVHFVLPDSIGHVVVRSDVDEALVLDSIRAVLG